jgi:hypothetical protein
MKMKRSGLMTGMLLMLLIAGNTTLNAQRGMRGEMDSTRMNRNYAPVPRHGTIRDMGPGRSDMRGTMHRHGNMRGMGPGQMYGRNPQARFGMRGTGHFRYDHMGMRPYGPARDRILSIPNLTDKQKTEIAALRKQQQEEMMKFREEFSGKVKVLRDEHRKKIMGLLTDEQKKLVEQVSDNNNPVTPKEK